MVRPADPAGDAAACAAIYAPYVDESPVSFEEVVPSADDFAARIARIAATHPWLVCERDGTVAGFAYGAPHRERAAYRWATDVSVYVDPAHQGRGIGRELYEALFARLRAQRFQIACAGITLPNDASVGLHESLGFEPVGVYHGIGWKAGAWRDVGWWQLRLLPPGDDDHVPPEPLPPADLIGAVPHSVGVSRIAASPSCCVARLAAKSTVTSPIATAGTSALLGLPSSYAAAILADGVLTRS